jgi:hypothetical protein
LLPPNFPYKRSRSSMGRDHLCKTLSNCCEDMGCDNQLFTVSKSEMVYRRSCFLTDNNLHVKLITWVQEMMRFKSRQGSDALVCGSLRMRAGNRSAVVREAHQIATVHSQSDFEHLSSSSPKACKASLRKEPIRRDPWIFVCVFCLRSVSCGRGLEVCLWREVCGF